MISQTAFLQTELLERKSWKCPIVHGGTIREVYQVMNEECVE